jgi:hypothetical protein
MVLPKEHPELRELVLNEEKMAKAVRNGTLNHKSADRALARLINDEIRMFEDLLELKLEFD